MAESSSTDIQDRAPGPTYKSLFLAACAIIGSAFGWWFTNFITYIDTISARVAALEVSSTENKWAFRINGDKISNHEDRLRTLEREHNARQNGRDRP